MKRRNFVQRWWDRRSSEESLLHPPQWLLDLFGVSNTASGESVTTDSALLNSNVYTCASVLGGDIGKLPIQVFKKRGAGIERDSSHPVSKLLGSRPNPYMSAYTFKELMQVHVTVWGNGYANIEWETSGPNNGLPKGLWPLDPSRQTFKLIKTLDRFGM